jgi:hypothetical protein
MDRPADHDKRMQAAEARAEWELGDRSWAGIILAAYWNLDEDTTALKEEQDS